VAARLQRLEELESLKRLSPVRAHLLSCSPARQRGTWTSGAAALGVAQVEYFRNCVSDIGDFKRLEKLAHVLQRVRHLRVFSLGYKLRWVCCHPVSPELAARLRILHL